MKEYLRQQVDEYRRLYGDELPIEFVEQFANTEKSRAKIDLLKEQIKKDGIKKPLLLACDERLKRRNVDALLIDGNHRLIAARELGMKRVPVDIVLP